MENNILLELKELKTWFYSMGKVYKAVDGVSFSIQKGKTLGIVGESGCGKSVTALSILRLVQLPQGKIISGEIQFDGRDLLKLKEEDMLKIRGNKISMIFQEPMTSLNPVFTIGDQIGEVFRIHKKMSKKESYEHALRMLETVKMPSPEIRIKEYPHQMSGGMRQRVMIAMALACNPAMLIADEPTTALDVTVQAQILELMDDLKAKFNSSIMMITHDLGIIAEIAEDVIVMYAGMIVEKAPVIKFFDNPLHPYTKALLKSRPSLYDVKNEKNLYSIPGNVPDPSAFPEGCRFHPRCLLASEECRKEIPELRMIEENHFARCIKA